MEKKTLFYQYNENGPDFFIGEGDLAGFEAILERLFSENTARKIVSEVVDYNRRGRRSGLKPGQCYYIQQQEGRR
ncbi:MAG: hypothetical protein ACLFNW_10650 [Desulfobacterales bacterium]